MKYKLKAREKNDREIQEIILSKVDAFFERHANGCKEAVIYGAGELGKQFRYLFGHYGIKLLAYWDRNAKELGEIDGVPVFLPFEGAVTKERWVFVCLYDDKAKASVISQLQTAGYQNVVDCGNTDDLSLFYQAACYWGNRKEDVDCGGCSLKWRCPVPMSWKLDEIAAVDEVFRSGYSDYPMLEYVSGLATGITWECSLRCKGCVYSMPHIRFARKGVRSSAEYLAEIETFLLVTEYLFTLIIGYGETLLYQDVLLDVLRKLVLNPKVFTISIVTNATIPLKQELVDFFRLHKDKMYIRIDDYELPHVDPTQYQYLLEENGIIYSIKPKGTNTWYDMRTTGNRSVADEDLPQVLKACQYWQAHGFMLVDGYLYPRCCGQQEVAEIMGTLDSAVRVDLMGTPVEQLAEKLWDIHENTTQMEACQACPMIDESVIIPAGEQMTAEEFREMREEYLRSKQG